MFFPYRAQISLYRLPIITLLVSVLCIALYTAQFLNQHALVRGAIKQCEQRPDRDIAHVLKQSQGGVSQKTCVEVLLGIHLARDKSAKIQSLTAAAGQVEGVTNGDLSSYYAEALQDYYRAYARTTPGHLTARLWYKPESWSPLNMLSASVAHGSWAHLIGNLFFFFAFAATLEVLLGPVIFSGVLLAFAFGTHAVYSLATLHLPNPLPTVGLSGVIMGVIALFAYFLPRVKIRCFFWLIVFYRRIGIPAWLLAAWFVGWDVYSQLTGEGDARINLVAHLSGAALGLLLGITLFRAKRHWAQELVES